MNRGQPAGYSYMGALCTAVIELSMQLRGVNYYGSRKMERSGRRTLEGLLRHRYWNAFYSICSIYSSSRVR